MKKGKLFGSILGITLLAGTSALGTVALTGCSNQDEQKQEEVVQEDTTTKEKQTSIDSLKANEVNDVNGTNIDLTGYENYTDTFSSAMSGLVEDMNAAIKAEDELADLDINYDSTQIFMDESTADIVFAMKFTGDDINLMKASLKQHSDAYTKENDNAFSAIESGNHVAIIFDGNNMWMVLAQPDSVFSSIVQY